MMSAVSNEFTRIDGNFGVKLETPPIHSGLLGLALPWLSGRHHKETMRYANHIGAFIVLTRDRDGGRVTVDKRGQPILSYTLSKYDRQHLLRGVAEAAKIHVAAGAEEVYFPHNSFPVHRVSRGEQELSSIIQGLPALGWKPNQFALFSAHQMASCRMGGIKATHPIAPDGETYEIKNLYVADGSAFPECSGANPMLSIQALAHFTAQGIKARFT